MWRSTMLVGGHADGGEAVRGVGGGRNRTFTNLTSSSRRTGPMCGGGRSSTPADAFLSGPTLGVWGFLFLGPPCGPRGLQAGKTSARDHGPGNVGQVADLPFAWQVGD